MSETAKKPRQGSAYGKVIDRIVYPANVYHWPAALKEAGVWVGNIIGSRVEKGSNDEKRVVVTLECDGGITYDGFPLEPLRLVPINEDAHVYGPDSFLVTPNEFFKSNLRRVVQDRRAETRPGTTRLAIVDRNTLREVPQGPADLVLVANNRKAGRCPRPDCNGEISDVTANPAVKTCTYCNIYFGPGSGARNEALPLWDKR